MNEQLFETITQWQDATFPGSTWASKSVHLKLELVELSEAVTAGDQQAIRSELADCFILLFGMAHKLGFSYDDLWHIMHSKHAINLQRKWGAPDADGVVQHVEEGGQKGMEQMQLSTQGMIEQQISRAWTWLAKREKAYDNSLGDCFTAHDVLKALKMAAQDANGYPNQPEPPDDDDDTDEEPDFNPCDECDRPDACADFGCAIKAGLRMGNPW